jgi:gelsolin
VRYLDGGIASGFKHVDPDQVEKKLLQVKGKRNVRVRQVDLNSGGTAQEFDFNERKFLKFLQVPLDVSSMNKGDCFVLDAGKVIYVYMGNSSKKVERLKAIQAANQVRDQDHAGKAKIVILGSLPLKNKKNPGLFKLFCFKQTNSVVVVM